MNATVLKKLGRTPPRPLVSWSYSRYSSYKQCPLKFFLENMVKLPQPKNEAMERGGVIHKYAEDYLKGVGTRIPVELKAFETDFKRLRAKRKKDPASVIVEDTWAFTHIWGPSRWDDWNNCWLRVKLDVAERTGNHVVITDYKTGKFRADNRADYMEQQELYATGSLLVFGSVPDLKVTARLVYLDADKIFPEPGEEQVYTKKDLPALQKTWEKRVKPMFNDKKFAPKPNQFCGWCAFRKSNNGPCQY